jgi:alanine dehydrogenase
MIPARVMARGEGFWLRGMCAISPSGEYMGCKLIAASPTNRRASYLISLFHQQTMNLEALIDGNRVTAIRTAASAALAVDLLAPRRRSLRVGVLGSGTEAQGLLEALVSLRTIAQAHVFSPSLASRLKFVETMRLKVPCGVIALDHPEDVVRASDVVLCAARSRDESPVLRAQWLAPGTTVASVGSTLPEQREVDERTLDLADVIVADMPDEVAQQSGDGLAAIRSGIDLPSKLVSLNTLVHTPSAVRREPTSIVVYKSVGSALQDIVIAEMLLRCARSSGRFSAFPAMVQTIQK